MTRNASRYIRNFTVWSYLQTSTFGKKVNDLFKNFYKTICNFPKQFIVELSDYDALETASNRKALNIPHLWIASEPWISHNFIFISLYYKIYMWKMYIILYKKTVLKSAFLFRSCGFYHLYFNKLILDPVSCPCSTLIFGTILIFILTNLTEFCYPHFLTLLLHLNYSSIFLQYP